MLEVKLEGLKESIDLLNSLKGKLDVEEILDEAEALLLNRIRTRFLQQVDSDGKRWQELSEPYKTWKRSKWGDVGILFASGNLFHSIHAYRIGPGGRGIGTDVPYARKHQLGLEGLPKREFLAFSNDDLMLAEMLVLKRIQEA